MINIYSLMINNERLQSDDCKWLLTIIDDY